MVDFILLLILTSLWIWGFHGFFQLNDFFTGKYSRFELPIFIRKPLFDCPPCMSSIHGTISYFLFTDYPSYHAITLWIAFCFCLCGLNYIIKEHLYES